ncbi:hypothetical protein [Nocardia sp. NBC_00416]|uniref:hypothetical protein n=1 Tax=Nocardia sp. NBC_00416 TaxID=2975991 RepID=UPI002E1A1FA5
MTALAELVSRFARIVTEHRGRDLADWITGARAAPVPELDPFSRGIDRCRHCGERKETIICMAMIKIDAV